MQTFESVEQHSATSWKTFGNKFSEGFAGPECVQALGQGIRSQSSVGKTDALEGCCFHVLRVTCQFLRVDRVQSCSEWKHVSTVQGLRYVVHKRKHLSCN